jgi:hypothetical protein
MHALISDLLRACGDEHAVRRGEELDLRVLTRAVPQFTEMVPTCACWSVLAEEFRTRPSMV